MPGHENASYDSDNALPVCRFGSVIRRAKKKKSTPISPDWNALSPEQLLLELLADTIGSLSPIRK
jgi:hypothetical protein